nr:unnamed protein product [Callosobruchus analis]
MKCLCALFSLSRKLKRAVHDAAFEALGEENRTDRNREYWWNEEVEKLVTEKKHMYNKWLATNDPSNQRQYQEKRREIKQRVCETKNKQWEESCARVEQYIGGTRTKEAWNEVKNIGNDHKGNNINMIISTDQFKNYFSQILKEDRGEYIRRVQPRQQIFQESVDEITYSEVQEAVREIKMGKHLVLEVFQLSY